MLPTYFLYQYQPLIHKCHKNAWISTEDTWFKRKDYGGFRNIQPLQLNFKVKWNYKSAAFRKWQIWSKLAVVKNVSRLTWWNLPPFLLEGWGWTFYQIFKNVDLPGPPFLEGCCLKRGGVTFFREGGCNFYTKS